MYKAPFMDVIVGRITRATAGHATARVGVRRRALPPRCVTNLNIGRPFDGSIGLENRCINTLLRISKECMQRYEVSCMSSPVLAASELTVLAKRRMPFRSAT